ncbi:MAG: twin-arginine translocation signal domain-containing protein, partial [Myxococcales bacterium]|nr:twin-arginine translocation signal domain-containing protein [Myxococcales bacterium]
MITPTSITRRRLLAGLGAMGAGLSAGLLRPRPGRAHADDDGPRFLIVLTGSGGASLLDAMLAIRESECASAGQLNCFPDAMVQSVAGSPFRAVDQSFDALGPIPMPFSANQSEFVTRHHQDMMVATLTGTSVNHAVAQRRSVTGNEVWRGRTLQEAVALQHGGSFALPNVHLMAGSGFTSRGTDEGLPPHCFGETVADPALWPLALDGVLGTSHPVERDALAAARSLRNDVLDPRSRFSEAFGHSPRLQKWRHLRGVPQQQVETAALIDELIVFPDSAQHPLTAHGLQSSPDAELVRATFPRYATDPLDAQAALAFLLLKNRISVTVTLGPSFNAAIDGELVPGEGLPEGALANPPIAFDFSHQSHRAAQAFMWSRVLRVADGLITLLQGQEWADGQSMWDRTMIYLATDFGRSKNRPEGSTDFGSGHDINNGVLVISPLVKGNTVLGGVDHDT